MKGVREKLNYFCKTSSDLFTGYLFKIPRQELPITDTGGVTMKGWGLSLITPRYLWDEMTRLNILPLVTSLE